MLPYISRANEERDSYMLKCQVQLLIFQSIKEIATVTLEGTKYWIVT